MQLRGVGPRSYATDVGHVLGPTRLLYIQGVGEQVAPGMASAWSSVAVHEADVVEPATAAEDGGAGVVEQSVGL